MRRPTPVTVFGILNVVSGLYGAFHWPVLVAQLYAPSAHGNRLLNTMRQYPVFHAWMLITISQGPIAMLVLIVAGIGLLRLKLWAWKTSIGYGNYAVALALVNVGFSYVYMTTPLVGPIRGAVGALLGGLLGLSYPLLLIFFMTRERVRSAFVRAATHGSLGSASPSY
jgi:hypothetical protein